MSVDTPEELDSPLAAQPQRLASHLAAEKVRAAAAILRIMPADQEVAANTFGESGLDPSCVLVAFDTIVFHEGRVLGKPRDIEDAWRMLRSLSGDFHDVVTGVAVLDATMHQPMTFAVTTKVRMKNLDDKAISAWMARGEYMGCAGAYNIERQVAEVEDDECFQNVAGLPLCHLYQVLSTLDLPCDASGLRRPVRACNDALARRCLLGPAAIRTERTIGS